MPERQPKKPKLSATERKEIDARSNLRITTYLDASGREVTAETCNACDGAGLNCVNCNGRGFVTQASLL